MSNLDYKKLAEQFVTHATKTGKDDALLIFLRGKSEEGVKLAEACKMQAVSSGATALIIDRGSDAMNHILASSSPEDLIKMGQDELAMVKKFSTNINICDDDDVAKIKGDQAAFRASLKDALNYRANNHRWLVVNAPSREFAAKCGMEKDAFDKFYSKVCLLDYTGMARAVKPLQQLMDTTNDVHIVGPGTDLHFSIAGLKSKPCIGERNIPDGECYTAPKKFSVNGHIAFGPSIYNGKSFSKINLRYTDGYISHATGGTAQETEDLNLILNTDPGSRFTGEFALGFNPHIDQLVGDILFDEKRRESIHIAQGQSYKGDTYNGNDSLVHWDMVHSQSEKDGGGQIWFDGKLIRHNGKFILPDLEGLNPENLI